MFSNTKTTLKDSHRLGRIVRAAAATAATLTIFASAGTAEAKSACDAVTPDVSSLGGGMFPNECWRPYSPESPFNQKAVNDPTAPGSEGMVDRLTGGGPISYYAAGDPARDYGMATFYADSSDPTYELHCVEDWGRCAIEGMEVHVPEEAHPSGVWPLPSDGHRWDSHLTIIDTETGWEYDLWDVRSMTSTKITTSWGGKTRIDGSGIGSDAVAAQFGSLAGVIRGSELEAGKIRHALTIDVPCTNGYVAPATKGGWECTLAGMPVKDGMPMGTHLVLDISRKEVRLMDAPRWKKAIINALRVYGAYVSDTTGSTDQWSLNFESHASWEKYGAKDPIVEVAKDSGITAEDYNNNGEDEYWMNIHSGVNWDKLRVVEPSA